MINEMQLKEKLQVIERNKFHLNEKGDLSELIPTMLQHIGSTDGVLRDKLIYSSFATWIMKDNALSQAQLHPILSVVLDEKHLLYGIGERDTDSVFTRSFSALLLPLLLISNRSKPFIPAAEIHEIKEKLLTYLANEKDRRGYVEGKGWAHSIAHAADAVDDLVQCPELDKDDLLRVLVGLREVICITDIGYIYGEEERVVTPVMAVIKRQLLNDTEISQWIEGFGEITLSITTWPEKVIIRSNTKTFLQSLHFRLQWELETDRFVTPINQTLKKINPFVT